jgi:phosphoserine phosphatase RsbU/P
MLGNPTVVSRRSVTDARILIVDDNAFNRTLLSAILAAGGFSDLHVAADGREALEAVFFHEPDLIILDLLMPGLDGYAVTRALRADPRYADLPILVQTVLAGASQRGEAFQAGATDLVIKPVDQLELLARATLHLQNRQLIRDLRQYHERIRAELDLAGQVCRQLLPGVRVVAELEHQTGVRIHHLGALSEELGGELWGARALADGRLAVYVLEIAGRGVTAALDAVRMHALLDDVAEFAAYPARFLNTLNRLACSVFELGHYASALAMVWDARSGHLTVAAAGSAFLQLVTGEDVRRVPGRSMPLGVSAVTIYDDHEVLVPADGLVFLGTSGSADSAPQPMPPTIAPSSRVNNLTDRAEELLAAWAAHGRLSESSLLCLHRSEAAAPAIGGEQ